MLGNRGQQLVVRHLGTGPSEMRAGELARVLAQDASPPRSTERATAYLHHVVLPKLADEGVINYDSERGAVALSEDGRALVERLESTERRLFEGHRRDTTDGGSD